MSTATMEPTGTDEVVARDTPSSRERITQVVQQHGGEVVLVIVVVLAAIFQNGFLDPGNLRAIFVNTAYTSLIALGMTFVIITGGIDLSVGSVFALGGVLAAYGAGHGGWAWGILLPLLVCGAIGALQGWLVARVGLAPFIVTLAGMLGARGLLQAVSDNGTRTYLVPDGSFFEQLGTGFWRPTLTAVVAFVIGGIVLQRSRYGQALFALGGNESAATLMGLPVSRTKLLVYTVSGLLAGGAGMLNASRLQSGVTNIGTGYELTAIAAVIIGGTLLTGGAGSITGTVAGVLLLAVITNVIGVNLSQYGSAASDAVNGLFLAVVVLIQTYLSRAQRLA